MLELSPEVNRTSVFGLLLGYPVVYWYSNVSSADNCLSQVPLRLFRILTVDSMGDRPMTVIYSFTVPEQLYGHCQSFVDSWQKHLLSSVSRLCLDWVYSLHVDCRITIQSAVCMWLDVVMPIDCYNDVILLLCYISNYFHKINSFTNFVWYASTTDRYWWRVNDFGLEFGYTGAFVFYAVYQITVV